MLNKYFGYNLCIYWHWVIDEFVANTYHKPHNTFCSSVQAPTTIACVACRKNTNRGVIRASTHINNFTRELSARGLWPIHTKKKLPTFYYIVIWPHRHPRHVILFAVLNSYIHI